MQQTGADSYNGLTLREAATATAATVHWRRWAARRARKKQGFSAIDRIVGFNDNLFQNMLRLDPEVFFWGMTLEESPVASDLSDWVAAFAADELGRIFLDSCGKDISDEAIEQVAAVPNLVYTLISVDKHQLLLQTPLVRRAIVRPSALAGDWLVSALSVKHLRAPAVSFLEFLSAEIANDGDDKFAAEVKRREVFTKIASLDTLVGPMLRLPVKLQERLVKTEACVGVLDELLCERPLALLVVAMDGSAIVALLFLLMRAVWLSTDTGPLSFGTYLYLGGIALVNTYFTARTASNVVAMRRLKLSVNGENIFDILTIFAVYLVLLMAMSSQYRSRDTFLGVAATASGMCWWRLLVFVSGLHLKFALYVKSLVQISLSLRSFVLILFIVIGAFGKKPRTYKMLSQRMSVTLKPCLFLLQGICFTSST